MIRRTCVIFFVTAVALLSSRPLVAQVLTNVLTGPTTVAIDPTRGATFTIGSNNLATFSFTNPVVVWLRPVGTLSRTIVAVTLCGPPGVTVAAGIPAATTPCSANLGRSVSIAISPVDGPMLMQSSMPAPSGYWNLFAMHTTAPMTEASLPTTIRFVPATTTSAPPPPPPVPTISTFSLANSVGGHPQCVQSSPSTVTINVQGQNFDSAAHIVVSYIYFIDSHFTFNTMYNGRDSRVGASMLQQTPTFLSGTVDLAYVHHTAGDTLGLGGNYYVQVQNGNGQVDPRSPNYFTALPYSGAVTRCN